MCMAQWKSKTVEGIKRIRRKVREKATMDGQKRTLCRRRAEGKKRSTASQFLCFSECPTQSYPNPPSCLPLFGASGTRPRSAVEPIRCRVLPLVSAEHGTPHPLLSCSTSTLPTFHAVRSQRSLLRNRRLNLRDFLT